MVIVLLEKVLFVGGKVVPARAGQCVITTFSPFNLFVGKMLHHENSIAPWFPSANDGYFTPYRVPTGIKGIWKLNAEKSKDAGSG